MKEVKMFDEKSCENYKYDYWYPNCKIAKQFGYDENCMKNAGGFYCDKVCHVREKYYKEHPETYIQFGKYKYKKYKDIPSNYLAWLLKQDFLKGETRKYVEDVVIEEERERIIKEFIDRHYETFPHKNRNTWACSSRSRTYSSSSDYCPHWMDYGSDLMDCMEEPF